MQQRTQFIDEYLQQQSSLAELCRRFGIRRKTGYVAGGALVGAGHGARGHRLPQVGRFAG